MKVQPTNYYGKVFTRPFPSSINEDPQEDANALGALPDVSTSQDKAQAAELSSESLLVGIRNTSCTSLNSDLDDFSSPPSRKQITMAYEQPANVQQDAGLGEKTTQDSDWEKYKDDQLLRDPGGDHYYLDKNRVLEDPKGSESFETRLEKDLSDSFGNVKNFFGNLLMGSTFRYRDENNECKEAAQQGLVGTCIDFFKDLVSGLSFGVWHSDDEKEPQGAMERLSYVGSKLYKAFLTDLVEGVPQSANHMAKNLVLAGINLVQVLPDATIGNFEEGRKLTTTLFDNGQVAVEYLTDVIPSGDAWFRVHASSLLEGDFPFLYNLQMPEHLNGDSRWQYVRNTPFRKTIETVGTLLADIACTFMIGQSGVSTNQNGSKEIAEMKVGKIDTKA